MIFYCGEEWPEKVARLSAWHRWFAWRPVKVAPHKCAWLQWIERKSEYWSSWGESGWNWKYRLEEPRDGR